MHIKVYGALREMMGGANHDMPVAGSVTVGSILECLAERHPEFDVKLWDADRRLTGYITALLNGRSILYLDGLESRVTDADTLALFPPVGGG